MNDVRLKHRAELDAVMLEQAAYKRIIKGLVLKLKENQTYLNERDRQIVVLEKYKAQASRYVNMNAKLQGDLNFYRNQCDKFKIALIEYDRKVNRQVLLENDFTIAQLEVENANLRRLLNIPEELFKVDPEDEKKKAAEKKKNVLKSIDEKLKQAEKKI